MEQPHPDMTSEAALQQQALLRQQAEAVPRTCSDERPCVNCFSNQGPCLGPARASTPTRVSREELLYLANINLRREHVRLQGELMRRDERDLEREMSSFVETLNKKYGIDPAKQRVMPDGTIVSLEELSQQMARRA